MPELPEVETVVRGLKKFVKGKKILDIWSDYCGYFKFPQNLNAFRKAVVGKIILDVERKGKGVLFLLKDNFCIFIHQRMTGRFLYCLYKERGKKHFLYHCVSGQERNFLHLVFFLNKNTALAFLDVRKFAEFYAGPAEKILNLPFLENLGIDPLGPNFNWRLLEEKLVSNKNIKNLIMDQRVISGIGNIYANEILWKSKISPFRKANSLSEKEIKILYKAILFVLKKAIKSRGSSISDFRDVFGKKGRYQDKFLVYKRDGKKCFRCRGIIKRVKINNRGTFYCLSCQK